MSQFEFIKNYSRNGDQAIYVYPPTKHVVLVSTIRKWDGTETMIFPYNLADDEVEGYEELYCGYGVTHAQALREYRSTW